MKKKFETIIKHLIGTNDGIEALTKVDVSNQFSPSSVSLHDVSRNINAAFLILLAGDTHPLQNEAKDYFLDYSEHPDWKFIINYYKKALELIHKEIAQRCYVDDVFENDIFELFDFVVDSKKQQNRSQTLEKTWKIFFPQAYGILNNTDKKIERLQKKRKIKITKLNKKPIKNISKEMLFTSNILITLPPSSKNIEELGFSPSLTKTLTNVYGESQQFWYDHPIQMGVEIEKNEAVYGLKGLDSAITFEKERGTLKSSEKINCLLSVSVTHEGLKAIAKEYLEGELKKVKNIENLNIFVITEADASEIINKILAPAAKHFNFGHDDTLHEIFGVDGEYGRHYTLLKAISAFWQVVIDSKTKATFKFDLDQVFPQKELVEQSGASAFEHFKTPLWGAKGVDDDDNKVELGMIAGALVNQSDIDKSLFTPDVPFPSLDAVGSQLVFYSTLPQALSTQAEMMMKYDTAEYDGINSCIQRIHVTGGTNGILIKSLRKYRPFTPIFIGRAEDQAYILSVLFSDKKRSLRYVHKDGLIMRHDKHAFAQESIEAAHLGKMIGDYVRILYFSHYVRALPWQYEKIKKTIDPFTGSFVSNIPFTAVSLRMALEATSFFAKQTKEKDEEGFEFLKLGIKRVDETINSLMDDPDNLTKSFEREKRGWDVYYDILDNIEKGLKEKDDFALSLQKKAKKLMEKFKIQQI